jgi:Spy/CpxP family protein refolding chaperone
MNAVRAALLIGIIAFVGAFGGVYLGRSVFAPAQPAAGVELHALIHDGLDLAPEQHARLEKLEQDFAIRRRALELEMRADNARLAAAIEVEHGNGPQVNAAIDRTHRVMGQLQKETLAHVFAMRALLTPAQAAKFDKAVVKALTADVG